MEIVGARRPSHRTRKNEAGKDIVPGICQTGGVSQQENVSSRSNSIFVVDIDD